MKVKYLRKQDTYIVLKTLIENIDKRKVDFSGTAVKTDYPSFLAAG